MQSIIANGLLHHLGKGVLDSGGKGNAAASFGFSAVSSMFLSITGLPQNKDSWIKKGEFSHQIEGIRIQSFPSVKVSMTCWK